MNGGMNLELVEDRLTYRTQRIYARRIGHRPGAVLAAVRMLVETVHHTILPTSLRADERNEMAHAGHYHQPNARRPMTSPKVFA
jgi:hypothetical protein